MESQKGLVERHAGVAGENRGFYQSTVNGTMLKVKLGGPRHFHPLSMRLSLLHHVHCLAKLLLFMTVLEEKLVILL